MVALSHEFLGRNTRGAPDSQAMWRRIFLAEPDQNVALSLRLASLNAPQHPGRSSCSNGQFLNPGIVCISDIQEMFAVERQSMW